MMSIQLVEQMLGFLWDFDLDKLRGIRASLTWVVLYAGAVVVALYGLVVVRNYLLAEMEKARKRAQASDRRRTKVQGNLHSCRVSRAKVHANCEALKQKKEQSKP